MTTKEPKVAMERHVRLGSPARTLCIAFFPYTAVCSSPTAVTETLKLIVTYLRNNNRIRRPVKHQPNKYSVLTTLEPPRANSDTFRIDFVAQGAVRPSHKLKTRPDTNSEHYICGV